MSETISERIRRYVLDSSDDDLQRLLNIAELTAEPTRTAFRRIGMAPGWRVIDCGSSVLVMSTTLMDRRSEVGLTSHTPGSS